MELTEKIGKNQVLLLKFKDNPEKTVQEICEEFSNKGIALIVSSNSGETVLKKLENNKTNCSQIHVIDCISKKGPKSEKIMYTQGPTALTELFIMISKILKSKNTDILILDSISSLMIYNQDLTLVRFIHELVGKVRNTDKKLILTILEKDAKGTLASVPLFVDEVVSEP